MNGNLYRITSIPYNPNGGFASDSWKFNLSTNTWTRLANAPSSNAAVFPHAGSGKILCVDRQTLYFGYYFYQTATNSFSAIKNVSVQWPDYFCLAYKPLTATTGLLLISGSGKSFSSVVDWNAETITQTSRSLGAVSQSQAPGCVYDSATDRFWMFGARSNPGLVDEVNPSTWQVTPHSLSGDGVSFGSSYQGTYSRFVFMESFRAIGFVPTASGPAFVMRLP